jgi:hypothetical protein
MIQFNGREIEVFINDRLLAPNTLEIRRAMNWDIRTFFSILFASIEYTVSYPQDPRSLFSVQVRTSQVFDSTTLLDNLSSMASTSY